MEQHEHMAHMHQVFLKMCSSDQSVVIGPERHQKIVNVLLGVKIPTPSFKFWLKKNDFQLIDIPSTNETNVLVAPGKPVSDNETRYVRVLRPEDVYPAIFEIHANEQNHAGGRKCFKAASKLYYRLPRSYIEEFVRTCAACTQKKHRKLDVCSTYHNMLTEKTVRKGVLEKIKVNTIEINHVSSGDYTHVGMVEDQHSKFVVLFPLRSSSPTDVAQAFNHYYLGIFGPPLAFISDNGHQFMDQVLHELLHLWNGIPLTLINETPSNIAAQDVSDRYSIIRDTLSTLITEKAAGERCSWHEWLPDIALRLNTTQNEFKRSPYHLIFGRGAHGGEYNSNVIIKSIDDSIGVEQARNDIQRTDSNVNADSIIDDACSNAFVLEEVKQENTKSSDSVLASVGLERRVSKRKQEQASDKMLPDESPSKKLAKSMLPIVRNAKKKKKKVKKTKPFSLAGCKDNVVVKATTSGVIEALQRSKLGVIASASPEVHRTRSKPFPVDSDDSLASDDEATSDEESSSSEDEDVDILRFLSKSMGQKTKLALLKTVMTSLASDQKNKKKKKKKDKT